MGHTPHPQLIQQSQSIHMSSHSMCQTDRAPSCCNHMHRLPDEAPTCSNQMHRLPDGAPSCCNHMHRLPDEAPSCCNHVHRLPDEAPSWINHMHRLPDEAPSCCNHVHRLPDSYPAPIFVQRDVSSHVYPTSNCYPLNSCNHQKLVKTTQLHPVVMLGWVDWATAWTVQGWASTEVGILTELLAGLSEVGSVVKLVYWLGYWLDCPRLGR